MSSRTTVTAEIVIAGDRLFLAEHVEVVAGLVTATGRFARRRVPTGPVVRRTWGASELREIRWLRAEVDR